MQPLYQKRAGGSPRGKETKDWAQEDPRKIVKHLSGEPCAYDEAGPQEDPALS
jgi:hypothetical protein